MKPELLKTLNMNQFWSSCSSDFTLYIGAYNTRILEFEKWALICSFLTTNIFWIIDFLFEHNKICCFS